MKTSLLKLKKAGFLKPFFYRVLNAFGKSHPDDEPIECREVIEKLELGGRDALGIRDYHNLLMSVEGFAREKRNLYCSIAEKLIPFVGKSLTAKKCIIVAKAFLNGTCDKDALLNAHIAIYRYHKFFRHDSPPKKRSDWAKFYALKAISQCTVLDLRRIEPTYAFMAADYYDHDKNEFFKTILKEYEKVLFRPNEKSG